MFFINVVLITYFDFVYSICVVNLTNTNNFGNIYGKVLPAVLSPPYCGAFFNKTVFGTPLLSIMEELKLPYSLLNISASASASISFRSGSGFEYSSGFSVLKKKISEHISSSCFCDKNKFNITVFNRKTRTLNNFPRLLHALEQKGLGPIRYFNSSGHFNQCWFFCLYKTSKMVISVYGADSIYPFLLDTSFISIAYDGLRDKFVDCIHRSYRSSVMHSGIREVQVRTSVIVMERYSTKCTNFWKSCSDSITEAKKQPTLLMHKCISLFLDDRVIKDIVGNASQIIKNLF